MPQTADEDKRMTTVIDRAQVLIAGGGISGITAAIVAKKLGLDVILTERYGFLGGISTAGLLGTFCGFYTVNEDGTLFQIVKGFGAELLNRLKAINALGPVRIIDGKAGILPYDSTSLRIVTDQLIREYDIKIYLHSLAVSVSQDFHRLKSVIYESKSGRFAIEAETFIDATGDGDIAANAGAQYEINPGKTQFPTTIFCIGNVDLERVNSLKREELAELMERSCADGEFELPRTDARMIVSPVTGELRCNFTRVGKDGRPVNGLDVRELSYGEIEGRLQALEYLRFFRQKVPGFENASISQLPVMLGVRETRRIVGEYQLTKEDVLSSRKFDDAIGCNAWPIELHQSGTNTNWLWLPKGMYYQIPYRCLTVKGVSNLLAVGRCLSTTQEAQASTRIIASCINQGEAAAVACAISLEDRCTLKDIDIGKLKSKLGKLGVYLG